MAEPSPAFCEAPEQIANGKASGGVALEREHPIGFLRRFPSYQPDAFLPDLPLDSQGLSRLGRRR